MARIFAVSVSQKRLIPNKRSGGQKILRMEHRFAPCGQADGAFAVSDKEKVFLHFFVVRHVRHEFLTFDGAEKWLGMTACDVLGIKL